MYGQYVQQWSKNKFVQGNRGGMGGNFFGLMSSMNLGRGTFSVALETIHVWMSYSVYKVTGHSEVH